MPRKKNFEDPLKSIDPVMQSAFSTTGPDTGPSVSQIQFPKLNPSSSHARFDTSVYGQIPVGVSVELGRSKLSLKSVMELAEGSIVELERLVGEPLDLVVNGQVIAQGEVVAIDNHYGIRLTNIVATPG